MTIKVRLGLILGVLVPIDSLGIRGLKGTNKHFSWFSHNNFSISKQKSMKFKHKVYDHKKKVGIDFGGCGPNS